LHKALGARAVLTGIDADVAEGAIVALVGASGSGKTTLLRCLNGLERFDAGSVHIAGHALAPGARSALPPRLRCDVGLVFQEYHLFPHLDALDNVTLATRVVSRTPQKEAEAAPTPGPPSSRAERNSAWRWRAPSPRARACSCSTNRRARSTRTTGTKSRTSCFGAVQKPKDRPLTLLVVTHDRGFAESLADEVWSLEGGRLGRPAPTSPAREP
jgi:ABC-type polar amino acid transport system ATPase subunit